MPSKETRITFRASAELVREINLYQAQYSINNLGKTISREEACRNLIQHGLYLNEVIKPDRKFRYYIPGKLTKHDDGSVTREAFEVMATLDKPDQLEASE